MKFLTPSRLHVSSSPTTPSGTLSSLAIVVALLILATASAHADPAHYRVDATHSNVELSISKWAVTRQEGIFRDLNGLIRMDPQDPESATVQIRIRTSSIDTRNDTRDRVVRSDDFLDVDRYPEMTFRSTRIRRTGSGTFDVTGDLTIRGVTRRITAPVRLLGVQRVEGLGEIVAFETAFVVNRREFGVLGSRWSGGRTILGDEVRVRLSITARREP